MVRALEVIELTGRPFTAHLPSYTAWRPLKIIGLRPDLTALDRVIDLRVKRMMTDGLIDEVRQLAAAGLRRGKTASRAIGYREALEVLDGKLTAAQAEAQIALSTRRLARRQMKWFRRDTRIHWLDAAAPDLLTQATTVLQ
jgi:tRNA dimethylallyltransferase